MRHITAVTLGFVSLLVSPRSLHGEGPTQDIPSDLILERFTVAKNGDCLLVPVKVAGKDYLFVVDTGSTDTVFDTSIPMGQPIDEVAVDGDGDKVGVKLYRPPVATIGRTSFGFADGVAGMNLSSIRQISGQAVEGILGMDFLSRFVVHIDVEKGVLLLLKSSPNNVGVELPISREPGDSPYVTAEIAAGQPIRFMIDTGMVGTYSGDLGVIETRSLLGKGSLREIGKVKIGSIAGTYTRPLFQGGGLHIGEFTVQSLIFGGPYGRRAPNILGLRFWSRFVATFDFPERKLYLRRSSNYSRPDRWNASGLHLWKRQDAIEIESVDPDSYAARAGLKKGEVLLELNGLNASKTSIYDLYEVLCRGGPLTSVVRVGSQERRLIIKGQ